MHNSYLDTLHLTTGASKSEIKTAYRTLSKKYHPDVSKDEHAKEKFIAINEAYKFLMGVGPRPATIEPAAPAYDFDPHHQAYETWRREARAYAIKMAREAERRQTELIKTLLWGFNVVAVVVILFNVLLVADSYLPEKAYEEDIVSTNIFEYQHVRIYDDLMLESHSMRFEKGQLEGLRTYQKTVVYASSLLDIPRYLDLTTEGRVYRLYQSYSLLGFFSFLTKTIFLLSILYRFVMKTLDAQLTIAILFVFISAYQLFLFVRF